MVSVPMVVAVVAGLGASFAARCLVIHCQAAIGQRDWLPQIAGDLRKLAAGTDTSSFLAEYVQLLKRLGWLAALQLVTLSIQLVTVTAVYAVTCWPLDFEPGARASNPLRVWLSDLEWTFLLAAAAGSIVAPLVVRSPA